MRVELLMLVMLLTLSCSQSNQNTNEEANASEKTTSPSKSNVSETEVMMNEHPIITSELQDFSHLPTDSIILELGENYDVTIAGYRKNDTLIVEGDMIFRYPTTGVKFRVGVGTRARQWPVRGSSIVVPYTISNNYRFPDDVEKAFKFWEKDLNIRFVRRNSEPDYIAFVPSRYTRSFLGKQGGRQSIELADWARPGNIAHEIGHALGLFHEHTRSDRDQFVNVDPSCNQNINFRHAIRTDRTAEDVAQYDFNSIMHYGPGVCFTVKQLGLPRGIPGQRDSISTGDYLTIREIYNVQ